MSMAQCAVAGPGGSVEARGLGHEGRILHRIAEVRAEQGISLRSAARQLSVEVRELREQEKASSDLSLSDLLAWQQVLQVPLADLLEEPESELSRPVLERAQMVRLMKTALSMQESTALPAVLRMAETMVGQLVQMMPELEHIGSWHTVGQRRSLDEYGRALERQISDDLFSNFSVE